MCWNSGCHIQGLCVTGFIGIASHACLYFVMEMKRGSWKNNQCEITGPVVFSFILTQAKPCHTTNNWYLAEARNTIGMQSQNLAEKLSLHCYIRLSQNLEYFTLLLSIHVALNELKYYAVITDDYNCRSKIACKIIIIKKQLPEAEIAQLVTAIVLCFEMGGLLYVVGFKICCCLSKI